VPDAGDPDAQLEEAVAAWRGWCQALEETGVAVLGQALIDDEIDLAEGLRHLGRASHFALFGRTENRDSAHPYFWPYLGPHVKIGGDNPQGLYLAAPINPHDTFIIRGTRGSARWFSAVVMRGPGARAAGELPIGSEFYLPDLAVDPDGAFELVVAPDERPGNWLASDPWADYVLVRQFFPAPDDVHTMDLTIENATVGDTVPEPLALADMVRAYTQAAAGYRASVPHLHSELVAKASTKNTFATDIGDPTSQGGVPGGNAVTGRWALEPDEALIIRMTPPVPCAYWDVQVGNGWYETFDYRHHVSGVTCEGAHVGADGSVTLVLSDGDPGTVNWLEAPHHREGHIAIRWQLTDGQLPLPETSVVPLDRVRDVTGLPSASVADRAAARLSLRRSFENRFRSW
jgi:Protein of unknown function (DUF1214)